MIYLDNAATTYPKPACVIEAVQTALRRFGANPGRGGHAMSLITAEQVYRCRESAAALLGAPDPGRVIFTAGCTASLNTVIRGLLGEDGRAVVSDLEHNAVMRPLYLLGERADTAAVYPGDPARTVEAFRRQIGPATRCLICTHASNVFGTVLPVRELAALAHGHGLPLVVDAAQTAGILPLHMERDGIDYLCAAGHKGLYGPMGTGLLILNEGRELPPLMAGGTGSDSRRYAMPADYPDRLESGTLNVPGICGLKAGIDWVRQRTASLHRQELAVLAALYDGLAAMPRVKLYTPRPGTGAAQGTVLAFTVTGMPCEEAAQRLSARQIAVRAGLHCAPAAHRHYGTLPDGAVRLSPGAFTQPAEVPVFLDALSRCLREP